MSKPRINLLRSFPRNNLLVVLIVLGLLGGFALLGWNAWRSDDHKGERIALAQVPAPVRATIELEAKGGTLREIDRTTVDGRTTYTASVVVNGKEETARIGDDGTLIGRGPADDDDD